MERKKRHVERHEKVYSPHPLIRTLRISDARVAHAHRDGIFPEAIEDVCPGYDDIGESDGLVVVVELQTQRIAEIDRTQQDTQGTSRIESLADFDADRRGKKIFRVGLLNWISGRNTAAQIGRNKESRSKRLSFYAETHRGNRH